MAPEFSIVVNSHEDQRFRFFESCFVERLANAPHEVVRIADARSMAEGYNRGAARARSDWLLFCHDDIAIVSEDPVGALREAMQDSDVFGVCGTRWLTSGNWYDSGQPHTFGAVVSPLPGVPWQRELQVFGLAGSALVSGAHALDGIFIGCRRSVLEALGGFDETHFPRFVGYDIDFTFRAYLAGNRLSIQTALLLLHLSNQAEFSRRKQSEWSEAIKMLTSLHGAAFAAGPGRRGHTALPLPGQDPAIAAGMLRQIRYRKE